MNNLYQLLQNICNSADSSEPQKQHFDQLLAYTQTLLKYHCQLEFNGEDILNLTLMAISGLDGKNPYLNSQKIKNFLAKLSPCLTDQQIKTRYRNLVVTIFNHKKVDLYRQEKPYLFCSLDNMLNENNPNSFLDLFGQEDNTFIEQENEKIRQALWKYLTEDTDKILINSYPKGHPQANLKIIITHRYLLEPQESWASLSQRLNIPVGTITAHFHRQGKPLLRKIVNSYMDYSIAS